MDGVEQFTNGVGWGFQQSAVRLPIDAFVPLKPLRPDIKMSSKFRQIVTSIRAVGLVEPPVVTPDATTPGGYFLLDGLLRIEALRDLGETEVDRLVSTDDEAFTYNSPTDPPSLQWTPMLALGSWRGVSDEWYAPGVS